MNLPHGLRYVLAHVSIGAAFPPLPNSAGDVALLRAANHAMQRKAQGIEDAFLFVVTGQHNSEEVNKYATAYGFPNATVVCIDYDDNDLSDISHEAVLTDVAYAVEKWLKKNHAGAVAAFPKDYSETEFWWSGIEHNDNMFDWEFDADDFAKELPSSYRDQAATWMSVLGYAVDLHAIQAASPYRYGCDLAAAWAATLCEWLHGFEAASGNSYNDFGYENNSILYPSEFFLGFELARLSGDDLETVCEETDEDIDGLYSAALKAITKDRRYELKAMLSDFFGGDGTLFWAVYSSIWPDFSRPMDDALERELGDTSHSNLARLDSPWRFVSEGWCENAED